MGKAVANNYPKDVAKALVEGGATDAFVDSCPAVRCFLAGGLPWLLTLLGTNEGGSITKSKEFLIDNERVSEGDSGTKQMFMKESLKETLDLRDEEVMKRSLKEGNAE